MPSHRSQAFCFPTPWFALFACGFLWLGCGLASAEPPATQPTSPPPGNAPPPAGATIIPYPKDAWPAAGIAVEPAKAEAFSRPIRLTGKISLNEDRLAHIYPIVEGQVNQVQVGLGDVVKENDLLVVVHSREVGTAKLELYQAQLQLEMARVKHDLEYELANNTQLLIHALRQREGIEALQERFSGLTMGDYRERLLQAYSSFLKSEADVARLANVSHSGAIATKHVLAAQTSRNADLATFQARLEQIEYEIKTAILKAAQAIKESETRVAVTTTNLRILGCEEEDIRSIDPVKQGEAVSHFAIRAPLSGTIISKDVVLREQVRPDVQIMSIADLSTVWVEADVYEKDVPLLQALKGKAVHVQNESWPDREFKAKIFFTGEIMDEKSRTISMRAIAENPDFLLKPGMFVTIGFQADHNQKCIQVPSSAVLEDKGVKFLFVHLGEGKFERRDIKLGPSNGTSTVVESGLREGEAVVTAGGFILKSRMLESLLEGE